LWIDAFLFRVKALLDSADKGLILSLEQRLDVAVDLGTVFCGFVDYAVLRGPKTLTGTWFLYFMASWLYILFPEKFFPGANLTLDRNKEGLSLFIDEAKSFKVLLENFLPQTVGEMYAGMKAMK